MPSHSTESRSRCGFPRRATCIAALFLGIACTCGEGPLRPADTVLAAPRDLDFGDVPRGIAKTGEVTLSVTGVGTVNLHATRVVGPDAFAVVSALPDEPLLAGGPATLSVRFVPPSVGTFEAMLQVDNDSVETPDLAIPLRGRGVEPPACDDGLVCTDDVVDAQGACSHRLRTTEPPCVEPGTGPGGGHVNNCDGRHGSPSCDIIQVPASAGSDTATALCPEPYTLIGCGFLCDGGARPGGTEMVDETACRAHCSGSARSQATAFCYRGDASRVVRVVLRDVARDTVGECPESHPQVLGCTTRCVNGSAADNPGGATLSESGRGCRVRCDWPGDTSPQLVVYCGGFPGTYTHVVRGGVPGGSDATCPAGTTLAGGLGMCVNGRTGGFIATDSRQYIGLCAEGLDLDQLAAFCLSD